MYDTESSLVTASLIQSNPVVFNSDIIQSILQLTTKNDPSVTFAQASPDSNGNVTVSAGAEVVIVASSDIFQTKVHAPANAPVVIFQGRGGVVATFNDGATVPSGDQSHVDRVVVGSAGNDIITITDAKNTKIVLGSGDSSVQTGHGVDTVQAGLGNSTITGGNGDYAVVKLSGNAANYQVTATNDGHAIVTDQTTHKTTDISKIQYVQLDNGKALIFSNNSIETQVADLYHAAMGRDADAGGLDYWFDLARAGVSLNQISNAFTASTEFQAAHQGQSDNDFIQSLYQNTFNRAGEDAGVAYWQDALSHGATKADLIQSFANVAAQNIHGSIQTEVQIVGSIHVITGII
jgi:hypothetical protein